MKVLITGAAGFLGRAFMRYHANAGDEVRAIDDLSSPYAYWPHELDFDNDVDLFVGDAAWALDQLEPGEAYDIAYHFAAPVGGRARIEHDPLFNADSLRLDVAFFRWAVSASPKVCVYPSSSAVYGIGMQRFGGMPLREGFLDLRDDLIPAPDEMYGWTKLMGEVLASKAAGYGLDTLCIRPFSGYGEDQSPEYPMTAIAMRAIAREDPLTVWGTGRQRRDFIHVDDIVGATTARIEAGVKGYQAMNIGSGMPVSFFEIAHMMADAVGYAPTVVAIEDQPMGVHDRYCDPGVMESIYIPKVSLKAGIQRVIERHSRGVVLG